MSASDIAAWLGAVTGSAALLWDIVKWSKTGPQLRISVVPNMTAFGAAELMLGKYKCVLVEASNVGDSKTTITHLVGLYYPTRLSHLLRMKPTQMFVVPDPRPGKLPHVLDRGERSVGMMEQSANLSRMSRDGYLYCGVYQSTSSRPVLARLVIRDA